MNIFQKIIILLFVNGVTAAIAQTVLGREIGYQILLNRDILYFIVLAWISGCAAAFYFVKNRSTAVDSGSVLNLWTALMPVIGAFFITASLILIRYFKPLLKLGPQAAAPDWTSMALCAAVFIPASFIIFTSFFCSLEAMKRAKIGNFLFPSLGAAFAGVVSGIAVYILWAVKNYTNMDVIYTMGMINIILSYLFFRDKTLQGRYLMLTVIACLIVYLGFNMAGTKQKIDSASARALYSGFTVISQNEYPTCNFVMAKKDDAYYVFESGSLAYEIPDASYKVLAAMARGPRVLVINGGLTGMADALSEVPGIKEIVCVEADPYIGVVLEKVYRESVKKKVDIKFISAMGHSLIGEAVKGQGQFDTIIVNPRMAGHFEGAVYNSKGFKAMLTAMLADKGQVIFGGNK